MAPFPTNGKKIPKKTAVLSLPFPFFGALFLFLSFFDSTSRLEYLRKMPRYPQLPKIDFFFSPLPRFFVGKPQVSEANQDFLS